MLELGGHCEWEERCCGSFKAGTLSVGSVDKMCSQCSGLQECSRVQSTVLSRGPTFDSSQHTAAPALCSFAKFQGIDALSCSWCTDRQTGAGKTHKIFVNLSFYLTKTKKKKKGRHCFPKVACVRVWLCAPEWWCWRRADLQPPGNCSHSS